MRYGHCTHHIVWSMSGPMVTVGCAHCNYVRAVFETQDASGDRKRSKESQLNHDQRCDR
jgi:hypothetical protein